MTGSLPCYKKYEGLSVIIENKIATIILNRPEKKNALSYQMYSDFPVILKEIAGNEDIVITVITGAGDYYSSGNDLSGSLMSDDIESTAKIAAEVIKQFVASFIDFPKPLVAAVNGPAVGFAVTLLGLCDIVYASDEATFYTPFSKLGLSPEGCSSYIFPKIMGYAQANKILLFNEKLTAKQAKDCGLVTEVFHHNRFWSEVNKCLKAAVSLSKNSLIYTKKLIRDADRKQLHRANNAECERLIERIQSPDCFQSLMDFFQKKGKL